MFTTARALPNSSLTKLYALQEELETNKQSNKPNIFISFLHNQCGKLIDDDHHHSSVCYRRSIFASWIIGSGGGGGNHLLPQIGI